MSLAAGNYTIVNAQAAGGVSLAVNFNGLYQPMTVTKNEQASSQVWTVSDPQSSGLQGISPLNGRGLYIVPGDNHDLHPSASPGGFVWSIMKDGDWYTIETQDGKRIWDIQDAKVGESVLWQSPDGVKNDFWNFAPLQVS